MTILSYHFTQAALADGYLSGFSFGSRHSSTRSSSRRRRAGKERLSVGTRAPGAPLLSKSSLSHGKFKSNGFRILLRTNSSPCNDNVKRKRFSALLSPSSLYNGKFKNNGFSPLLGLSSLYNGKFKAKLYSILRSTNSLCNGKFNGKRFSVLPSTSSLGSGKFQGKLNSILYNVMYSLLSSTTLSTLFSSKGSKLLDSTHNSQLSTMYSNLSTTANSLLHNTPKHLCSRFLRKMHSILSKKCSTTPEIRISRMPTYRLRNLLCILPSILAINNVFFRRARKQSNNMFSRMPSTLSLRRVRC